MDGARLCRIRTDNGVKLYWKNLRDQFGQEPRVAAERFLNQNHGILKVGGGR